MVTPSSMRVVPWLSISEPSTRFRKNPVLPMGIAQPSNPTMTFLRARFLRAALDIASGSSVVNASAVSAGILSSVWIRSTVVPNSVYIHTPTLIPQPLPPPRPGIKNVPAAPIS